MYKEKSVHIVRGEHKKKDVYHIYVSGRYLFHVSNPDTAKRIAVNFLDVVTEESFKDSVQQYHGVSIYKDLQDWRKRRGY